MVVLILSAIFATSLVSCILNKLCSNILSSRGGVGKALYIIITGVVSCFFFWMFSGFTLEINLACILLGALYSVFCIISLATVTVYKYADMATVNVTKSASSLIVSSLVGFTLFAEDVTYTKLLRILIMLGAILCIFLDAKTGASDKKSDSSASAVRRKNYVIFALIMLLLLPVTAYSTFQANFVAEYDIIPDMNSYFFVTNAFMVVFSLAWLGYMLIRKRTEVFDCLKAVRIRQIFTMSLLTVNGNISAILGVVVLKYMDVSVFSPLNSALTFIVAAIVSMIFREKVGKFVFLSLFLAIIAVTFEPIINAII